MSASSATRRAGSAVAGLVFAGAAIAAAVWAPWPRIGAAGIGQASAPTLEVTPIPSETVLACDGPILALGRDAADAQGLFAAADVDVTLGNSHGDEPEAEASLDLDGVAGATRVSQLPDGSEPVSVAASASADVDEPDIRGLAASACRTPQPESWLVGATVATGVTDILIVSNPSEVIATVIVDVFGVDGRQDAPDGEFALQPGERRAIPVAGLAGGEQAPVLRVTSEGAPVVSSLQSSEVTTLDPTGLDLQAATTPGTAHVIPRVTVTSDAADSGEAAAVLRLLATAEPGTARISVVGVESGRAAVETSVDLAAGEPTTLGLPDLGAGSYTVRIDADVPVVAAAQQLTEGDYAWATPAEPLDAPALVAVPSGPESGYAIALAAGSDDVTATVERLDGSDAETVTIEAGRTKQVSVDPDRVYRIVPDGGAVSASVNHALDGAITSFAVIPDPAAPEPIVVSP